MKTARILFATVLAMLLVDGQVALGQSSPWTQNGDKVYVTDLNANVGIGTTFPVVKFAVDGDAAVFGGIFTHSFTKSPASTLLQVQSTEHAYLDLAGGTDATSTYRLLLGVVPDFGYVGIFSGASGGKNPLPMRFVMGATEVMRFDTNGNVGIGTTTPQVLLHLNSESGSVIRLEDYTTGAYTQLKQGAGTGEFRITYNGTGGPNIAIQADGDIILAKSAGNIGIGTTSPGQKLSVNGKIETEEIIVVPDVVAIPDFVFEDDYALRSLAEVERYIDAHGHLPEIPSAAQMKADGVGLSAMQMKLLQKVEELTLYLIEQQKQNETLRHQNEALVKQMAPLTVEKK